MENSIYYNAIKNTVDYYRTKGKNDEGFYLVKQELNALGVTDIEHFYANVDYKRVFLRSYYKRYYDTSPSFDFDGKEINWESRFVAEILFKELLDQLDDKESVYKYKCSDDISLTEYQELLKTHGLL